MEPITFLLLEEMLEYEGKIVLTEKTEWRIIERILQEITCPEGSSRTYIKVLTNIPQLEFDRFIVQLIDKLNTLFKKINPNLQAELHFQKPKAYSTLIAFNYILDISQKAP